MVEAVASSMLTPHAKAANAHTAVLRRHHRGTKLSRSLSTIEGMKKSCCRVGDLKIGGLVVETWWADLSGGEEEFLGCDVGGVKSRHKPSVTGKLKLA